MTITNASLEPQFSEPFIVGTTCVSGQHTQKKGSPSSTEEHQKKKPETVDDRHAVVVPHRPLLASECLHVGKRLTVTIDTLPTMMQNMMLYVCYGR